MTFIKVKLDFFSLLASKMECELDVDQMYCRFKLLQILTGAFNTLKNVIGDDLLYWICCVWLLMLTCAVVPLLYYEKNLIDSQVDRQLAKREAELLLALRKPLHDLQKLNGSPLTNPESLTEYYTDYTAACATSQIRSGYDRLRQTMSEETN